MTRRLLELGTPPGEPARGDVHLRSINDADGHHVEGTNDPVGYVAGFIVDEATWEIRYLVIDTLCRSVPHRAPM